MINNSLRVDNASGNFTLMGEDASAIMQLVLGNLSVPQFPNFDVFHAHCEV
jgi:hypothetical protein